MKRMDAVKQAYKEVNEKWQAALATNNSEAIEEIEETYYEAEDALVTAFLTKLKTEATPSEFAKIAAIAHTDDFIARIAA